MAKRDPSWDKFSLDYTFFPPSSGASFSTFTTVPAGTMIHNAVLNVPVPFTVSGITQPNLGCDVTDLFGVCDLRGSGLSQAQPYLLSKTLTTLQIRAFDVDTGNVPQFVSGNLDIYLLTSKVF